MAFPSLEQLKSKVWDTRDDGVKELKKAGFKPETATYRLKELDTGRWTLEELDPDASQVAPDPSPKQSKKPAKSAKAPPSAAVADKTWPDPTTANKWLASNPQPGLVVVFDAAEAIYCLRPAGTKGTTEAPPTPASAATPAKSTKPAKAAKAAPAKPAKAKGEGTRGKSSDPSPDELPPGFDDWLVEEGAKETGILRTAINTKLGFERRWMPHLKALGKTRGYEPTMKRDGRYTRFFLKKI